MPKTFQAFVDSLPESVTTTDVVNRAIDAGYTTATAAKVHSARYTRRKRHARVKPATGGARAGAEVAMLRRQIYLLGLDRSRSVLDECQRAFDRS